MIEWFLHADSDGVIFGLTANPLCISDIGMLGTAAIVLRWIFLGKISFGQELQNVLDNDRKMEFFLYCEKFCHWFFLHTYLSENWYCYLFYCNCRMLWSHISPHRMTGSHLFFACRQITKQEKSFNQIATFSFGCGAHRLLKSYSVTKNRI